MSQTIEADGSPAQEGRSDGEQPGADEDIFEDEQLVEDVSIDGMCGVY